MNSTLKYVGFLALLLIQSISISAAQDDFWGDLSKKKYINADFVLEKLGNLDRYQEFYEKTLSEIRNEYISEAKQLLEAGATGAEAMKMVASFDNRASARREEIFNFDIGKSIARFVRIGLDSLYNTHLTYNGSRLLTFTRNNPRYQPTLGFGPIMSGSGVVYATLSIEDRRTGDVFTVYEMAHISKVDALGRSLALKLFHNVHRTRFPLEVKTNNVDKNVFHLQRPLKFGAPTSYRNQAQRAQRMCQRRGMRLPTISEMEDFFMDGIYGGGVGQASRKSGWAATRLSQPYYVNDVFYKGTNSQNRPAINFSLNYLCVEEVIWSWR